MRINRQDAKYAKKASKKLKKEDEQRGGFLIGRFFKP